VTPALLALMGLGQDAALLTTAVFLRVGAAMALLPAFGSKSVPVRVRLGLTFAFTAVVAPSMAGQTPDIPADPGGLLQFLGIETVAGLALGFSVRLFIWMLQVAGTVAAQAVSLSQILGGTGVDPQPAMAQMLMVAGLALAAMTGLHVRVAEALIQSYDALPMGGRLPAATLAEWATARVAGMFGSAFAFAAPFVIGSVIYNLALGVINRAMPQLMVAFVGAPAITAAGLVLLFLTAPILLPAWLSLLHNRLADPFGVGP
jgi:flagellar biosynthetic protein FliR